jgi:hypothetical protein
MAMSGREKAVLGAMMADLGLTTYQSFAGKAPTILPVPAQYPLILLLYGILWQVADTGVLGEAAVALAWLLPLGVLMHVNVANLGTLLGSQGNVKSVKKTPSITQIPGPGTIPTGPFPTGAGAGYTGSF